MAVKLQEVLSGKEDNYILPFFWQHGEDEHILREEMARIFESGIRAVCIEARPHPDYLGPQWWKDVDAILDEARTRDMRVWILDDDHFPTGHAAGRVKEAAPELRRIYLYENHLDAIGPSKHSAFLVSPMNYYPGLSNGGRLVSVIAVKRNPDSGELTNESYDLTNHVVNGKLYWDVPEGYWRIFSIIESEHGGDPEKKDYINHLVADSVRILIDTVHEAFYARYKEDFGNTIAGFFSDEPGFYNDKDTWDFNSKVGKKGVTLPWCSELYDLLEKELGTEYKKYLPLLWHDNDEHAARVRYCYMNVISKLYAENFTMQIGNWCRKHGVEYIGHVLEDSNVHSRLGSGAGHFFRALGGQDMSGVDVVLWQLRPGFDELPTRGFAGVGDSEFFTYGMAKMASSLGHLDPKKKGRTMAEVFGAYGWAEGLKLMKWLTDHMLVRGVNYFVPHAFSPKEYPDHDCPPHLYARGKNPQFRYYKYLNHYTNRMSHLLSGGTHIATAAVLYHAEAEWSGDYMYFQKPIKELMRSQIDCDVLSCDMIVNDAVVKDGKLCMSGETFACLIIPYSEALPAALLTHLHELADQGLPILFVDGLPSRSSEGQLDKEIFERLASHKRIEVVSLFHLAEKLRTSGFYDVKIATEEPYLRSYHVRHSDMEVYTFFNEHPSKAIHTNVYVPIIEKLQWYDAYTNKLFTANSMTDANGTLVKLELQPMESIVLVAGRDIDGSNVEKPLKLGTSFLALNGPWSVSTAKAEQYPSFTPWGEMETLTSMSQPELLPVFSGTFRYEAGLLWHDDSGERATIDLGEVFETAELFLNGKSAGVRVSAPYRYDVSEFIKEGQNTLAIEVTNTLVQENPDYFSRLAQLEPSGLLGPVKLYRSNCD